MDEIFNIKSGFCLHYINLFINRNLSTENLKFLSVDQALADLAYFISEIKQDASLRNAQVIVFGGSYAGNLAAWMRLKYPHLVQVLMTS